MGEYSFKKMPITYMLIAANCIAYLLCMKTGSDSFRVGGVNYDYITTNKEYIRLFSYMFLHGGMMHISSNMLYLFLLGNKLEEKLGSFRMIVIYGGAGFVGGLTSTYGYHFTDPSIPHFSVGASGAVYGVLCASIIIMYRKNERTRIEDLGKAVSYILIYAVIDTVLRSGIDVWCHLGGGIAGGILAFLLTTSSFETFVENEGVKIIGILLAISLCVVGVAGAGIGKKVSSLPDPKVDFIKVQYLDKNNSISYGDSLDKVCSNEEWISFISTNGKNIVEFNGDLHYKGKDRHVLIQFLLKNGNTDYEIAYFEMDNEAMTYHDWDKFCQYLSNY